MKKLFLIYCILFTGLLNVKSQTINWAKSDVSGSSSYGTDATVNPTGGVYSCGYFSGSVSFGSGYNFTSRGSFDMFVTSRDQNGLTQWAVRFGGTGADYIRAITTDAAGDIYVTGDFSGTCVFGTTTLTAVGGGVEVFVLKLTNSGSISWVKQFGGASGGTVYSNDITVAPNGGIYITGNFSNVCKFGPTTYLSGSLSDAYVVRVTSVGGVIGFMQFGSTGSNVTYGNSITCDSNSDIYFTGSFKGLTTFGTTTLTATGSDIYFGKMGPLGGSVLWVKKYGGTGDDIGYGLCSDNSSYVYLTGVINGSTNFDALSANSSGLDDIFVFKSDLNGNAQWVKNAGGASNDVGRKISYSTGGIILSGDIRNSANFGATIISSYGLSDAFISKLNTSGTFLWAIGCGGSGNDFGAGVTADATAVYANGYYNSTGNFGTFSLTANGTNEAYTLKLSHCNINNQTVTVNSCNSYIYQSQTYTTTGVYTFTNTNLAGCDSITTLNLTISASPTISVNSGSVCSGKSFTMSPSGASTYTYSSGSPVVSPTSNATYSVTGTSAAGCLSSNIAISSVTVNLLPTISVNSGSICSGSSFTMTPSGASTYTFSGGSAVVSPTVNTSYSVTGTSALGCISVSSAISSVTVISLPTISVNSGSICSGSSFTMTPSGASTYTFSGGSAIVSPATSSNYTVTGTSSNGCVSSTGAVSSVTVNSLPNVTASTNNTLICSGQAATLTASGASTYTWSNSQNSANIVISPTTTTSYTLSGTGANGCNNSTTLTQSVSACTGLQNIDNVFELNIFPNPNKGLFTINTNETCDVEVIDILGSVISKQYNISGNQTMDISNYANGVYFMKIKTNQKQVMVKQIVKQ